jgi:predicted component of type VI protein secretion system
MLAYYLGVPVDVEMFGQGWENIDEKFQGKLSLDRNSGSVLGENMILGKRVKMYQRQCRISIGPLDESRFQDFLPGGVWLNRVKEVVRVYWNNSVSVDLKLIRKADSIGPSFLGLKSFLKKLGRDTWVFSRNLSKNRNDCHFKLLEIGSFQ